MMGFRLIVSLILLSIVCNVYPLDNPIREEFELSSAQKRELTEAPAMLLVGEISTQLKHALELQQVEKILAAIWNDDPAVHGWINYAPIRLTEARRFQPRILCVKEGNEMPWIHCHDQSYTVAELSKGNIIVDEEISNENLQGILDFVQASDLSSSDKEPIIAERIYQVVQYKMSKNIGVFTTTPEGKHTGIYLRPVTIEGRETYETTNSICKGRRQNAARLSETLACY